MKSTIKMFRDFDFEYIFCEKNKIIFSELEELNDEDNGYIIFDLKEKTVETNILFSTKQKRMDYLIKHFEKELGWK